MLRLKSILQLSQFTQKLALNEINRSNGVFFITRRYISKTKSLFQEVNGVLEGEVSEIIESNESNESDTNDKSLVPQYGDASIPKLTSVLVLPIASRPIFPGLLTPVLVKNAEVREALAKNGDSGQFVGIFFRADTDKVKDTNVTTTSISPFIVDTSDSESEIITHQDQLYKVGTFAQIYSSMVTPLGTQLFVMGHRRINLDSISSFGPPCISTISHWPKESVNKALIQSPLVKAYINQILLVTREILALKPYDHIQQYLNRIDLSDPYKLADFTANMTTANGKELQKVLECSDVEERLSLALDLLHKERDVAKLEKDINDQVEAKITKQQREYMLREQLKKIEEELNIKKDDKDNYLDKYDEKRMEFLSRNVNENILKSLEEEIQKLSFLDRNSSEFSVTRSYLDWLTHIPWNLFTQDKFNLKKAQKVLDEDHYGMDEVKKRILEFMAVGKLKKSMTSGATGKIICLIGPPGVGKTSIAKSIASALDRKFYRFSVGGLTDMAEIKGHRRTYIGAMPGKPVQCLKSTGCMNPVILIDEIDKLGRGGYNGDPASALLELLDPNQNASFVDHYLDLPTDFSQVLFLCTANDENTIPGPLRDRMEIIRLSGYDITEKVAIATRYLVPKAVKDSGLTESPHHYHIELTSTCLEELIKNYCRESGVRSLEKHIEKLIRKIAFDVVSKIEHYDDDDDDEEENENDGRMNQMAMSKGDHTHHIIDDDHDDEHNDNKLISNIKSFAGINTPTVESVTITATTAAATDTTADTATNTTADTATNTTADTDARTATDTTATTAESDTESAPVAPVSPVHIVIHESDLEKYLGKPRYPQETIYDSNKEKALPPGIVMGLAWSPLGGSPIFIETAAIPTAISESGGGVNVVTGQLGSVMKESANIAYTFARRFIYTMAPENLFFKCHQLHLHVPEGAVEKDGPSAGVAMACSFISLSTNTSIIPHLAMTGELSLTGLVLPVGGIKEKILAGRRAGATSVILPHSNRRDYDELPNYVKDSITVHFAKDFSDVYKIAFPIHHHHHHQQQQQQQYQSSKNDDNINGSGIQNDCNNSINIDTSGSSSNSNNQNQHDDSSIAYINKTDHRIIQQ